MAYDEPIATLGGEVTEKEAVTPPKTRDERIVDWKKENQAHYEAARRECCNCAPSRAQMLLVDQYEGRANCPID
jgi:hypothetical protein